MWPVGRCEVGVDRAMTLSSEDDQSSNRVFYSSKVVDDLIWFGASQNATVRNSLVWIGDLVDVSPGRKTGSLELLELKKRGMFPGSY